VISSRVNNNIFQDLSRPVQVTENATGSISFVSFENFSNLGSNDQFIISDGVKKVRFYSKTGAATPAYAGVYLGLDQYTYGVQSVSDLNTAGVRFQAAVALAKADGRLNISSKDAGSGKVELYQDKVGASTYTAIEGLAVDGLATTGPLRATSQDFGENVVSRFYDPPTIAYFSLDKFFEPSKSTFENRVESAASQYLSARSGSAAGYSGEVTIPITHSTIGFSGSLSNPKIINTPTRVLTKKLQNVVDFDNIGNKFLLLSGSDINSFNPAPTSSNSGRTFMLRCMIKSTAGNNCNILSISDRDTSVFSFYLSGKTIRARLHAGGSDNIEVIDVTAKGYLNEWVTIFAYANKTQIGPSTAFSVADGKLIQSTAANGSLSAPAVPDEVSMYVGYGVAGEAPGLTFATSNFLNQAQISEIAVFDGQLTAQEMKWIATSHLAPQFVSGISNLKSRKILEKLAPFPAYPTVARNGNQERLGNRKVGFDDTRTLIFTSTGSVAFPEMLPPFRLNDKYNNFSPVGNRPINQKVIATGPFGPVRTYGPESPGGYVNFGEESVPNAPTNPFVFTDGLGNFLKRGPYVEGDDRSLSTYRGPAITTTPLPEDFLKLQRNAYQFVPSKKDISVAPEFLARETIEPFNETTRPTDYSFLKKKVGTLAGLTGSVAGTMSIVIDLENSAELTVGNTGESMISTAYYNFTDKKWEASSTSKLIRQVDTSGKMLPFSTTAGALDGIQESIDNASVPFFGQAGFCIYPSGSEPVLPLKARARPSDFTGFPFSDKYKPTSGQKLKMSDYITEDFLLQNVYFEIDGEIFEAGDEALGYLMSNKVTDLPHSGSTIPGASNTEPCAFFGRASVLGGVDLVQIKQLGSGPGNPNVITEQQTFNQMFIPDDSSKTLVDMNSTGGIINALDLRQGDLQSSAPAATYWRCDSLFILRERPGTYSEFSTATSTSKYGITVGTVQGKDGNGKPVFDSNPHGQTTATGIESPGWRINPLSGTMADNILPVVNIHMTSSNVTRELVTYAQFTHSGYVMTNNNPTYDADGELDASINSSLLKLGYYNVDGTQDYSFAYAHVDVSAPYTNVNTLGMASGFINPPTYFPAKSEADLLKHPNYRDFGTLDTPGSKTNLTLLEAGLSRDKDYRVSTTGLTAGIGFLPYSTLWISTDVAVKGGTTKGFTANFPSVYLNSTITDASPRIANGKFRVYAPCRSPAKSGEISGITFTAEAYNGAVDPGGSGGNCTSQLYVTVPGVSSNTQRQPEISSGRSYVRTVPGRENTDQKLIRYTATGPKGAGARLTSAEPAFGHAVGGALYFYPDKILQSSTGIARSYDETSPYILTPDDELIIGFAPSMPGTNEGTNRPLTPGQGQVITGLGFDNINYTYLGSRTSLDTAVSMFRFKKAGGKIILYGTKVGNKKKVAPVVNQELTTLSAHEALGASPIPLDQYLTAQEAEYTGSNLTRTITGSMGVNQMPGVPGTTSLPAGSDLVTLNNQDFYSMRNIKSRENSSPAFVPFKDFFNETPRGVAGDLNHNRTSGLWITGSFNRFVQIMEKGPGPDAAPGSNFTFYTDTIVPSPGGIWKADGRELGWYYPNIPYKYIIISWANKYASISFRDAVSGWNQWWNGAFPFEPRYKDVPRLTYTENFFGILGMSSSDAPAGTDPAQAISYASTDYSSFPIVRFNGSVPGAEDFADLALVGNKVYRNDSGWSNNKATCLDNDLAFPTLNKQLLTALYGFGDGLSGSLEPYNRAQSNGGIHISSFAHPRGWRYGLGNVIPVRRKFIFRPDRYGQFRDMLEQPYDSSLGTVNRTPTNGFQEGRETDWDIAPAIICQFRDGEGNLLPRGEQDQTSCNNMSIYATSSLPYFDNFEDLTTRSRSAIFLPADVQVSLFKPELPDFPNLTLG